MLKLGFFGLGTLAFVDEVFEGPAIDFFHLDEDMRVRVKNVLEQSQVVVIGKLAHLLLHNLRLQEPFTLVVPTNF